MKKNLLKSNTKNIILSIVAVLFWLLVWEIAALTVSKELILPSPVLVLQRISEWIFTTRFWIIISNSLLNILLGILIGFILGSVTAILTTYIKPFEILLKPFTTLIKVTPVASFILLLILWTRRETIPSIVSVLIVFPIVWANISQGIVSVDKKLVEVAKVFQISLFKKIGYLYIPSVLPSVLSALRSSIGLAWKAGISAEILALPQKTIGYEMFEAKNYLLRADVFAWTVVIILLSVIIEKIILFFFDKLLNNMIARRGVYDKDQ